LTLGEIARLLLRWRRFSLLACHDLSPHSVGALKVWLSRGFVNRIIATEEQKKALQWNFQKFNKDVPLTGKVDPLTLKILKDKIGPSFDVKKTPGSTILQSLKSKPKNN
jgi:hypothetical protein